MSQGQVILFSVLPGEESVDIVEVLLVAQETEREVDQSVVTVSARDSFERNALTGPY